MMHGTALNSANNKKAADTQGADDYQSLELGSLSTVGL